MNYEKFIEDGLKAIDSMSLNRFEEICILSGYTPVRKFLYSTPLVMDGEVHSFCTRSKSLIKSENASNDVTYDSFEMSYEEMVIAA